jgi:hypothetical protein
MPNFKGINKGGTGNNKETRVKDTAISASVDARGNDE